PGAAPDGRTAPARIATGGRGRRRTRFLRRERLRQGLSALERDHPRAVPPGARPMSDLREEILLEEVRDDWGVIRVLEVGDYRFLEFGEAIEQSCTYTR